MKSILFFTGTALCSLFITVNSVFAQGTAFTYQGQLDLNGAPASGNYNLAFALYATNVGGVAVAGPVTNTAIAVSNGLFIATLDFGGDIFSGSNYWLDISVQPTGGNAFIELMPRQEITPAPYAIFAGTAATVSGGVTLSQLPAAVLTNNDTNVNLGGVFTGNGGGLTNLNASNLMGTLPISAFPVNVLTVTGQGAFQTNVYAAAGTYNLVIPPGATQIIAKLWGAGGGGVTIGKEHPDGGGGAFVQTSMDVIPGQTFTLVVGQHGDTGDNDAGGNGSGDAQGGNGYAPDGAQGGQASSLFYFTGGGYIMEAIAGAGGGANGEIGGGAGGNPGADGVAGAGDEPATGGDNGIGGNGAGPSIAPGGPGASYAANATTVGIPSLASANGNGGDGIVGDDGGGGGGGFGGGGGGADGGGAGGGGSYGQIIIAGNGGIPGNTGDPFYVSPNGTGGPGTSGADGLVVIIIANPPVATGNFVGNGGGLTNLQTTNLLGMIPLTNVSGALVSNMTYSITGNVTGGFSSAIVSIENTDTSTNCGPALRVQADGSTTTAAALSVSSQNTNPGSLIAQFGNGNAFVANIAIDGTVNGKVFNGTSDRNAKENFAPLNSETMLDKVSSLSVTEWNYKDNSSDVRHIGPVAQDFHAAFGLNGGDDKHISVLDEGGVALAAIKGLNQKLETENAELRQQNDSLAKRLNALEAEVRALAERK